MLRVPFGRFLGVFNNAIPKNSFMGQIRLMSSHKKESDEEFDCRMEAYLNRPDIDGWELRGAFNNMATMDMVPDPKIIIAGLKACRRINDYALTVRWLETIKFKSLVDKAIYPYLLQEIRPTLDELGINTPEELGYDKPELALQDVDSIH